MKYITVFFACFFALVDNNSHFFRKVALTIEELLLTEKEYVRSLNYVIEVSCHMNFSLFLWSCFFLLASWQIC